MRPGAKDLRPQLARDLRFAAKYFRLSPAAEKTALDSARRSVHRAARIYRDIAVSLQHS